MTLVLAAFAPPYWLSTLIKVLVISAVVPTTALIRAVSARRRRDLVERSSSSPTE